MTRSSSIPFVVGQWVRGERFYGRREQLSEILDGNRNSVWLLGTRRVGKTSLLKQLEHLTASSPERGYFPVFWDLQGSEDPAELHLDFADALLDAEEQLARLGLSPAEVEDDDLFAALDKLGSALTRVDAELSLLCDEVDDLAGLGNETAGVTSELLRALRALPSPAVIFASSVRLADRPPPLLEPCGAPLYLGHLPTCEALALIRQERLPAAQRPGFDRATEEAILAAAGGHPMLLQLLAKRCCELGRVEAAIAQVAADRSVRHLFAVDLELLRPAERDLLRELAAAPGASPTSPSAPDVTRLLELGLVRRAADRLVIHGTLLADWLKCR